MKALRGNSCWQAFSLISSVNVKAGGINVKGKESFLEALLTYGKSTDFVRAL